MLYFCWLRKFKLCQRITSRPKKIARVKPVFTKVFSWIAAFVSSRILA